MPKIVYFVVGVDLEAKNAFLDDDLFMARFDKSEQVFDEETGEWLEDDENEFYDEAVKILNAKPIGQN